MIPNLLSPTIYSPATDILVADGDPTVERAVVDPIGRLGRVALPPVCAVGDGLDVMPSSVILHSDSEGTGTVKIPFVLRNIDGIEESPCTAIGPMGCGDLTSVPSILLPCSFDVGRNIPMGRPSLADGSTVRDLSVDGGDF